MSPEGATPGASGTVAALRIMGQGASRNDGDERADAIDDQHGMSDTDRALLERARTGDREALGELYDRHADAIYRYLARRCGDPATAEDLTGAVFLRVVEAIHDDNPWRTSFTGWLYRIAHNLLTDHHRRRGRRPTEALDPRLPTGDLGPTASALQSMEAEAVRRALPRIRRRYAEILLLRFAEGLSHREVADVLGMTPGAVKVGQHRALKALERVLQHEEVSP